MSATGNLHRPLLSGVRIIIGWHSEPARPGLAREFVGVGHGTLTGLARRKEENETFTDVLITNQHVLAGKEVDASTFPPQTRSKNLPKKPKVNIYQGGSNETNRVGIGAFAEPIVYDADNVIDAGGCSLGTGVTAKYALHSVPASPDTADTSARQASTAHDLRYIRSGVKAPAVGMKLIMLGALSGEQTVTVTKIDATPQLADNERHITVIEFSIGVHVQEGDSGAPLFYHDTKADTYQLAGIVFAYDRKAARGQASRADRVAAELNLEFGKRRPNVSAVADLPTVRYRTKVTLDGRGSRDYEGDTLKYKWEHVSPTALTIAITDSTKERATFTTPNWRGTLAFKDDRHQRSQRVAYQICHRRGRPCHTSETARADSDPGFTDGGDSTCPDKNQRLDSVAGQERRRGQARMQICEAAERRDR